MNNTTVITKSSIFYDTRLYLMMGLESDNQN